MKKKRLSSAKAKKILEDGSVRGHKLTTRQKKFFGFIAGGGTPTKSRGKHGDKYEDEMMLKKAMGHMKK